MGYILSKFEDLIFIDLGSRPQYVRSRKYVLQRVNLNPCVVENRPQIAAGLHNGIAAGLHNGVQSNLRPPKRLPINQSPPAFRLALTWFPRTCLSLLLASPCLLACLFAPRAAAALSAGRPCGLCSSWPCSHCPCVGSSLRRRSCREVLRLPMFDARFEMTK